MGRTRSIGFLGLALLLALSCDAAWARRAAGVEAERFEFAGQLRDYQLYVPASRPRGVVLLLHGHGGSGRQLIGERTRGAPYRQWLPIADREGLVLLAPDGLRGGDRLPGWNDCRRSRGSPDFDDSGFLTALVGDAIRRYGLDASRVYAVGTSNGGEMALRLAIEHPDTFRGVAAIAAVMPAESVCAAPHAPVPVLFMHGTADTFMPAAGGEVGFAGRRGRVLSTDESAAVWTRVDGAAPTPRTTELPDVDRNDGSRVVRMIWPARDTRAAVALYRVEGGGHNEPSRVERYRPIVTRVLGPQNGDIEMADEVWDFFAAPR